MYLTQNNSNNLSNLMNSSNNSKVYLGNSDTSNSNNDRGKGGLSKKENINSNYNTLKN